MCVYRICTFFTERLDEPFCVSVSTGRAWPGVDAFMAKAFAGLVKPEGEVCGTVVHHHIVALHAMVVELGQSTT